MIRIDYSCKDSHIVEIKCKRNLIPESIVCPVCKKKSTRDWSGMSIRSKTYVGTGGGRDMKLKQNKDVEVVEGSWIPYEDFD